LLYIIIFSVTQPFASLSFSHLSSPSDIVGFDSSLQLGALKYNAIAFYEHRPLN